MLNSQPKTHRQAVTRAVTGLVLVGTGLWLSLLSNPKRFSLSVADDRFIQLYAFGGLALTLVGIGLFLYAIGHTTESMPARLQRNANIGVGLGFALQLAGLVLPDVSRVPFEFGWALLLAGFLAFIWGGINYAEGKGRSHWLGLLGELGILGFVVLVLLSTQETESLSEEDA